MNWHERIEAARLQGGFTVDDCYKAMNWSTCFAAELKVKRNWEGKPIDEELFKLGCSFNSAVWYARQPYGDRNNSFEILNLTMAAMIKRVAELHQHGA